MPGPRTSLLALALLARPCAPAMAQAVGAAEDSAAATEDATDAQPLPTTDLHAIRVTERRPAWDDLYGFRPGFDPDANRFNRHWNEPPSVEDVALRGGYVQMGIDYTLRKVAETVTRLPGWKQQIQPAVARPPPLDEAQLDRAARLRDADDR